MSLSQFLIILKARWKLAAAIFASVVALVVTLTFVLPPKYKGIAAVVINSNNPDPINGVIMQGALLPSYLSTQVDVIQSDRVMRKVIHAMNLDASPELREQWRSETDGNGDFVSWLGDILQKALNVTPGKDSSVIEVSFKAVDPKFAAAMANAFVQAYIDTTLELRVEPARRFTALFNEQAKEARNRLSQAQAKLSAYQQEKGIVATDDRLDVENARLADLSNQLVALQSLSADSIGRKAQASADSVEVLTNPVIAGLKSDISRQEARLKELSAQYGPAHPQVQQLTANINEMRAKLDAETARVTKSLTISNTVNLSREAQIRLALEAQREKVLKFKQQKDQAAMLQGEIDNAQRSYDALLTRYTQTNLESQSNQTDVSIVRVATPPSEPSFPKPILNIIASIFLGGLLAAGAVVLKEMSNRKLRTEADMTDLLDFPLLGVMPLATDAKKGELLPVNVAPKLNGRKKLARLNAPTKP